MKNSALNEQLRSNVERLLDIVAIAQRKYESGFSTFLEAQVSAEVKSYIHAPDGFACGFFGGYSDAERLMFGVWPEYEEDPYGAFPIALLKIDLPQHKTLSHRDCMGAILALGLKREILGDILCDTQCFYVFVHEKMASYILNNLDKIGSVGVKVCQISFDAFNPPQPKTESKGIFVMSNRLDAVLAGTLDLSRAKAAELIHCERVSVNHIVKVQTDIKVNTGDLLSVRGFGRYKVGEEGNKSRKGRTYLEMIHYL